MTLVDQLSAYQGGNSIIDEDGNVDPTRAVASPPSDAEIQNAYVAPGREAVLPVGVIYSGDWRTPADGMGRHVAASARALAIAGVPVALDSSGGSALDGDMDPNVRMRVGHLGWARIARPALVIRHIIFTTADNLYSRLVPPSATLADQRTLDGLLERTIVYTSWERDRVAAETVDVLNRCGQVWLPCEENVRAFVSSGVTRGKVKLIRFPYDPSDLLLVQRKGASDVVALPSASWIPEPRGSALVPDGLRFYNIGKWEPRKNQHALIGAFLRTFSPSDKASLVMKTSGFGRWEGYPTLEESMRHWIDDPQARAKGWTAKRMDRRVRIIADRISEEEMVDLHRKNNIYVSPSHGEAVDLPAFDARCAGNALVHVGFGGSADYHDPTLDVRILSSSGEVPVHPAYRWEPDALWMGASVDDISEALTRARPPAERLHPPMLYPHFGMYEVGKTMRDAVMDLLFETGSPHAQMMDEFHAAPTFG